MSIHGSKVQIQSKEKVVRLYRVRSSSRGIKRDLLMQTRWKEGLGERWLRIPGKGILGQDSWDPDIHQTCHQGELGSRVGKPGHEMVTKDRV